MAVMNMNTDPQLIYDEEYDDEGELHGKSITKYPNGKLKVLCWYNKGKLNGRYIEKRENNSFILKGYYENSRKTGYWEYYNENGELERCGKYHLGMRIGYWETRLEELNLAAIFLNRPVIDEPPKYEHIKSYYLI